MSKAVSVAVALIQDFQGRFLITRRPWTTSHGGYWEFPGGKIEASESGENALCREIQEEVGLEILKAELLDEYCYEYTDKKVTLFIYKVLAFQGEASCLEGQLDLRWVGLEDFEQFTFPAANKHIVNLLRAN